MSLEHEAGKSLLRRMHNAARQVLVSIACLASIVQPVTTPAAAQGFGLGGLGGGGQHQDQGGLFPLPFGGNALSQEPAQPAMPEVLDAEPKETSDGPASTTDPASGTTDALDIVDQSPAVLARRLVADASVEDINTAKFLARWIEENVRLVPYHGTLKGGAGVLLDGEGNSLDRALLLAQMLDGVGIAAHLASVRLEPDAARRLLPQPVFSSGATPPGDVEAQGADEGDVEAIVEAFAASDIFRPRYERIFALSEIDQNGLAQAIVRRLPPPDNSAAQLVEGRVRVLQDYWIVLPAGDAGAALAIDSTVETEALAADRVEETIASVLQDRDLSHLITIRFVATVSENGRLRDETLLSHDLSLAQRLDGKLTFHLEPLGLPDEAFAHLQGLDAGAFATTLPQTWGFVPVLGLGGQQFAEAGFSLDGRVRTADEVVAYRGSQVSPINPGLFGIVDSLNDIVEPRAPDSAVVAGRLEITMPSDPLAAVDRRTHVRRVFDLREPLAGEAGPQLLPSNVAEGLAAGVRPTLYSRLFPMLDRSVLRIDNARMTFAHEARERAMLQDLALEAQSALESRNIDLELFTRVEAQSHELLEYAIEREFVSNGNEMIGVPNLTILIRGLRAAPDGSFLPHQMIDIVENRRDPIGAEVSFADRVTMGIRDTVAEAITLSAFSDVPVRDAIVEDITAARLIMNVEDLAELDLEARSEGLIRADLRAGNAVFLASSEDGRDRWWRVDRQSGQTLGMLDSGQGGTVVSGEYLITQFKKNAIIAGYVCALFASFRIGYRIGACGFEGSGGLISSDAFACAVASFVGGVIGAGLSAGVAAGASAIPAALGRLATALPAVTRLARATKDLRSAQLALAAAQRAQRAAETRLATVISESGPASQAAMRARVSFRAARRTVSRADLRVGNLQDSVNAMRASLDGVTGPSGGLILDGVPSAGVDIVAMLLQLQNQPVSCK